MIQVGIVGSLTAIRKHTDALRQIQDIRITGCWITGDDEGSVTDAETGERYTSAGSVTGNADALIIDAGGDFCLDLAIAGLRTARHVFLYPATLQSVSKASHLMKLAREAGVILRAGKTGNYNVRGLMEALRDRADINMIELQHDYKVTDHDSRNGIHGALLADLEVISSLVGARVISIKAKGHCMLSSEPDIINARLEFDNGCAVNYNCSLVATMNEFQGTLVLRNRVLKYDFITGELTSSSVQQAPYSEDEPIFIERVRVDSTDTLTSELTDFFGLIRSGPAFLSIYENGFEPYLLADRILEKVMKTLVRCS